jgi:hypothetical protein
MIYFKNSNFFPLKYDCLLKCRRESHGYNDGISNDLRNVGEFLPDYTVQHTRSHSHTRRHENRKFHFFLISQTWERAQ